jgi:hypothetical protein
MRVVIGRVRDARGFHPCVKVARGLSEIDGA